MNVQEVLTLLQNLTKTKISQTELGKALGKTRSDINSKLKRGTELKLSDIRNVENYFNVDLINTEVKQTLDKYETIKSMADFEDVENRIIDYYPDVFGSCGGGVFVPAEYKESISVPKKCFSSFRPDKHYSVINAVGDSMQPYIYEKDKLIVEHWDGEQIRDNHVYVFRAGENIFIKRLVYNIDQIVVKSDNEIYPIRFIEGKSLEDFLIIGEIVGLMRDMK